jgi:sulfur relay (sulfurtransferase) complex TusBCD TusD component (DsrE family)
LFERDFYDRFSMQMATRKLGILLSTPPGNRNRTTVVSLAREALRQGVTPYLYLIDDGVLNLDDPEIQALAGTGVILFACAYSAHRCGVPIKDDTATFSGLVVLSDLIQGCDRFVAFN